MNSSSLDLAVTAKPLTGLDPSLDSHAYRRGRTLTACGLLVVAEMVLPVRYPEFGMG